MGGICQNSETVLLQERVLRISGMEFNRLREVITMALLELKGVKKIYQQGKIEVPALRGIDLTVEKGEFTTVFGPSGSGKTTMLNIIGCLDKSTGGSVKFDGQELGEFSKKDLAMLRRHNIGFIFQSYNLIPVLTAYENVEFAIRLIGQHSKNEILIF